MRERLLKAMVRDIKTGLEQAKQDLVKPLTRDTAERIKERGRKRRRGRK